MNRQVTYRGVDGKDYTHLFINVSQKTINNFTAIHNQSLMNSPSDYPPIRIPSWIRRPFIQKHRYNYLFLFGDNIAQMGYKAQSEQARGEPNCYGIPTKRKICMDSGNCFTDLLEQDYCRIIDEAFSKIHNPARIPVIPFPKIGKGGGQLHIRAPKVYEHLQNKLKEIAYPNIEWDYQTDGMNY